MEGRKSAVLGEQKENRREVLLQDGPDGEESGETGGGSGLNGQMQQQQHL